MLTVGNSSRGASLGTVLVILALGASLAFTLAGLGLNHLNLVSRLGNARQARNLAESVASRAVAEVLRQPDYGLANEELLLSQAGAPPESLGRLTFDRGVDVYSTNNLGGDGSVEGWQGRVVPKRSLHLVGTGSCRGVVSQVEVIVHFPPFPYAVAASGPIQAQESLLVGGLKNTSDLSGGLDWGEMGPGHLASNATQDDAIVLPDGSLIKGDLQSSGGVVMDPTFSQIEGELRTHAAPLGLPSFRFEDYDPQGKPGLQTLTQEWMPSPSFQGLLRRDGQLQINGGLYLDGALVFVDGDIEIEGGVRGTGAIIATGGVTISGGAELTADSEVALLAKQDITLAGSGSDASFFQGLVYTQGSVRAEKLTVLGTLITNSSSGGEIELDQARVVHLPEATSVEIEIEAPEAVPYNGIEFHFNSDEGSYLGTGPGAGGNRVVVASRLPDGTFTLTNPATGTTVSGLTLAEAIDLLTQEETSFLSMDDAPSASVIEELLVTGGYTFPAPGDVDAPTELVVVDPNQLLSLEDQARVLLWREL